MDVACLSMASRQRSRHIAQAMAEGIQKAGDRLVPVTGRADACVGYGWKFVPMMKRHKAFAYADLGYWGRDQYYRFSVNGWSPEKYVRQGLPRDRFDQLGLPPLTMPFILACWLVALGTRWTAGRREPL